MPISTPPTPPSRANAATFAADGDAFLGWFPTLASEATDLETNVNNKEALAAASAAAAVTSQNAAAMSASSASVDAGIASAAAAAVGGSLPAQVSTNGKVLRSDLGFAAWNSPDGPARQIRAVATSENQIAPSASAMRASWSLGANTSVALSAFGPNGMGYVDVTNTAGTNYVFFTQTPVTGTTKTASVYWKGTSKPAAGNLIEMYYRDASNNQLSVVLPFSDSSIIADGRWRRYWVTATHAGSNVAGQAVYFCTSTGAATLSIADPQVNVGTLPNAYTSTGNQVLLDPNNSFDFDTAGGTITGYLGVAQTDDWVGIKNSDRTAATNNITIARIDSALIESVSQNIEVDINGAAFRLVKNASKGWLIK